MLQLHLKTTKNWGKLNAAIIKSVTFPWIDANEWHSPLRIKKTSKNKKLTRTKNKQTSVGRRERNENSKTTENHTTQFCCEISRRFKVHSLLTRHAIPLKTSITTTNQKQKILRKNSVCTDVRIERINADATMYNMKLENYVRICKQLTKCKEFISRHCLDTVSEHNMLFFVFSQNQFYFNVGTKKK